MIKHTILSGKVHVYKRDRSRFWQCSSCVNGKNRRTSTRCERLAKAKEFAVDWYSELRGKSSRGELLTEKSFADVAKLFLKEQAVNLAGERSPRWLQDHEYRLRLHLLPFLGDTALSQVTAGKI